MATGKTELAKALAGFLFGDEKAIVRYDMSEFQQEHSDSGLIGAPAGYVGYDEGGPLITEIRKTPFAVFLFDEVEKAHSNVFNVFLQLLGEGRLTDFHNRTGDFSNAIILFTSNLGSEHPVKYYQEHAKLPESYKDCLPASSDQSGESVFDLVFKKEFIGRITEFIPFAPITEHVARKILDIQLGRLQKQLLKKKCRI